MLVDEDRGEERAKDLQVQSVEDGEGGEDWVGAVPESHAAKAQRQPPGASDALKLPLDLCLPAGGQQADVVA